MQVSHEPGRDPSGSQTHLSFPVVAAKLGASLSDRTRNAQDHDQTGLISWHAFVIDLITQSIKY